VNCEGKKVAVLRGRAVLSITSVVLVAAVSAYVLLGWMSNPDSILRYGLGSIFLVSMISHLTVVARDMFIPMYLPLATVYNPLVLGVAAGLGAAIGEVTTYVLGWGVAETIEEREGEDSRLSRWIRKYGLWAVLLVAVTPLPDTPIVLLAGSNKLPFGRLFIVEAVGKTVLYSIGAIVGGFVFTGLTGAFGGVGASALMVAGSLVFCVLVTWKKSRDMLFGWFERLFD
jgi:membrane protein YqaA with SNARE-associated domain